MRSTVHQQIVSSSRSLALQQYDEAKKGQQQAVAVSSSRLTRAAAATTTAKPAAAETRADADWDLCGWQDEPSVPPAAVAAAIKLAKHQHALSPAQLSSPQQTPPAGSKRASSGGSSRRTTGPGTAGSPHRRQTQGAAAQRSSRTLKQPQQRPAGRTLQLGEEDSFGTAAEHYRPPDVASTEPADASIGAGYAAAAGVDTSTIVQEQPSTPRSTHASSSGACCHLPSLPCSGQQQQQSQGQQQGEKATSRAAAAVLFQGLHNRVDAQQTCTTAESRITTNPGLEQTADGDEIGEGLDSTLYASRGDSRRITGLMLPSRNLLPNTSSSSTLNSNILALQQRLLLPQPGIGMFGGNQVSSSTSAGTSSAAGSSTFHSGALTAAARPRSASRQNSLQGRGPGGAAGQQAAAVPAFSLHARMASTAARAQLLLCRELNSMVPPPAPRARPEAAAQDAAGLSGSPAACASQQQQQPVQQALLGQQQLGELDAGMSSLRFVTSNGRGCSRPSSAAKGKSSSSGLAGANLAAHATAAWDLSSSSYTSPGSSSSSAAADFGSTAASSTGSRRPVSASVGGAARWGSCSGSESGSSGRPSTSGSVLGSLTAGAANVSGNGSTLCQSKGLSAAAEYMACRATVGELLQRINSQKAAGVGPSTRSPATSTGGAGTAAAAALPAGDVTMSRDGRPAGVSAAASSKAAAGRPTGLTPFSSLKAYQAFQSSYSLADTSSTTVGSSQPCSLKSISSGASMSVSGLNISTNALELRSNAALRKCGSSE